MRYVLILFSVLFLVLGLGCQSVAPTGQAPGVVLDPLLNATSERLKPYVVLVSLDGFRYDYARKYHADHLLRFAQEGVSTPTGMIPSYPSKTFPNHWTLVTGLYPEHHGIVANSFFDPERKQSYRISDPKTAADGSWYGGTPIWVLAEKQGMRTACFFWPGSEAEIQGVRPTYFEHYDGKVPNRKRVDQVLNWLQLPEEKRPHFITLYFSDTDDAGHAFGPDSKEVKAAVKEVDQRIGDLMEGVKSLNFPVDVIVLADHGMVKLNPKWIYLEKYFSEKHLAVKSQGTAFYPNSELEAQVLYKVLHGHDSRYEVFRRADTPAYLHAETNARSGDPVIVANGPYEIRLKNDGHQDEKGNHGFDPKKVPQMKAIFFAEGPDFKVGKPLPSFPNIDVFPLIAKILGLKTEGLVPLPDGNMEILQGALR